MIYASILLLLLTAAGNYGFQRDGLSPGVVQPLLWSFLLAGASVMQQSFFTLSDATLFLSVLASLLFQAGFLLSASLLVPASGSCTLAVDKTRSLRYRNLLACVVVLVLPFYVKTAHHLVTTGPINDAAYNLRYALSDEGRGYGILAYGVTLSLFLLLLESFFFEVRSKWRLAAATALASVYCVLSTGRTFILFLLICLLFPMILNGRLRLGRGLLVLLAIFLPVFYLYSVTLGKDGGGGVQSSLEVFSLYLYGGIFAFDKLSQGLAQFDHGGNLFRAFFAAAHLFDPSVQVAPIVDDYEFIPIATNVYTIFGKAYRDFGMGGVLAYMFFVGVFQGHIYTVARRGSVYYRILLVFSFFALLMQFFQDQYLGMLSTWGQVFFLTFLFAVATRHGRRKQYFQSAALPQKGLAQNLAGT
ncbi:MAG: O-antigen polymerase [Nitrososphaerales archaeon]